MKVIEEARWIDAEARALALWSDEDVNLRQVLGLVAQLAAALGALAAEPMHGYDGDSRPITVRR